MTAWGDWGALGFWVAAAGLALAVAGLFVMALIRGRDQGAPAAAYDLQVYRDQLREVERDLARGTIGEAEAQRVRTEVSRRVLDADRALKAAGWGRPAPHAASWLAGAVMVAACLGAIWLYQRVGAPGYPDLPLAARLAQAQINADDRPDQATFEARAKGRLTPPAPDPQYLALVRKLRDAVAKRPDDLTGQTLLARNEARLGNFHAAWQAQAQVIRLKGARATAEDYARQADLMIIAAGGAVSPQAQAVLSAALKRDQTNGTAQFYWGLMEVQIGRPDLGLRIWDTLLKRSAPDDPWVAPIRAQIVQVAELAGVRYSLPPLPQKGEPSAADMKAAEAMPPAQRQEMIRGMVQGLAERLEENGGTAVEWARLIRAYGVLGEADKQNAALSRARAAYAGEGPALAQIEAAAKAPALAPAPAPAAAPATQMSPADRSGLIDGMVQRLADKLAREGGTAPEWARLIKSYGVLGKTDRARAIWDEAQSRFAGQPQDLATVRAAAKEAGVAE